MITVVAATVADAEELSTLINEVIARGGTTAHETPFTPQSFASHFLRGDEFVSCFKAVDQAGRALGYQSLGYAAYLPQDWGDIGTFARVNGVQRGVGTALFAETLEAAKLARIPWINATIRADNTGGLAYYSKMGFVDYNVLKAMPLKDGTPVDRICKRFAVPRDT
jgi:L-amino acid N-acyltransferase YncA